MKRLWLKRAAWILLTPIILFLLLMALLYVPPVQSLIRRQATSIASKATGMAISIERIDLRFPLNLLVSGVQVLQPTPQHTDTLLKLSQLNIHIQAMPLFKGRIEIDDISLEHASINSAQLIQGMQVKGRLGHFLLRSHGIDFNSQRIVLDQVELSNTRIQLLLADTTTTTPDTTALDLRWRATLKALKLTNVGVELLMPNDSLNLTTHIAQATLQDATADLGNHFYGWKKILLANASATFDQGLRPDTLAAGLNPQHLALRNINLQLDSVMYYGRRINAVINRFSLDERSGLSITSLTGRVLADSTLIRLPQLKLITPHSQITLTAQTYWKLLDIPTAGRLTARLDALIGKQDMMLLAGNLPKEFQRDYPFRPLVIRAGTEGNFKQMQISRFSIDLPGALSIKGGGEFWNLTDTLTRNGRMDFEMQTGNLNFLTALAGLVPGGAVVVPDSINLKASLGLEASQCTAQLDLHEGPGQLILDAAYNLATQAYHANLAAKEIDLHRFLPHDSIYTLSLEARAQGRGIDPTSVHTQATLHASLQQLHYARFRVSDVELRAGLKARQATASITSNNTLLTMHTSAEMRLDRNYMDGTLDADVQQLDLHKLGLTPRPLKRPFAFHLNAEARHDSVKLSLDAGDLEVKLRARSTLKRFIGQGQLFATLLAKQVQDSYLDHSQLRQALPSASMLVTAGHENPLSYFLATKEISFDDLRLRFGFSPRRGINGRSHLYGLRMDSLLLDTLFLNIDQDTTRLKLKSGIINSPHNPRAVFNASLTGEVRHEDAELLATYVNGSGQTGLLFGLNARPLLGGGGRGDGVLLKLIPQQPIIAFRKFHFVDNNNWMYLHNNMRVYANIDMDSDDGLSFRVKSDTTDVTSLQHLNIELVRLRLNELTDLFPYMPRLTGLLSAETKYVQTATSLQVSAEANIQQLTYEGQLVGNIGLGATWLPEGSNLHYVNSYFTYNDQEIMTADGTLSHQHGKDSLAVNALFQHFPLKMANAFVPHRMVSFTGDVDGQLHLSGSTTQPQMRGSISLDSVSVFARQAGARYWFDNRPLQISNNRLTFDKFAIYTTSRNPFTVGGNIDFRNIEKPTANLDLLANNYTLLDAARTRESLIYGRAFVDLKATVRGPLDGLTMRGSMNVLGNTNLTYVLTDSPLTVEDRLDGLVTFTSFSDTTNTTKDDTPTMSLGGMQMYMAVHIDNAVRIRADLSPDRSKFIELEGGGNLNLQYTPQGDMNLTGRYTLSGGLMKYSLPIIPLKEFQFNPGTYVDWRGNPMDPILNLKATERMRASVSNDDDQGTRMVNFDVSIAIKNRLESPDLIFDIAAPDDATIQNELQAMGPEERSKQAIAMLATGIYLSNSGGGAGLTMGTALNSVLQSQINALAGSVKGASISVGVEDRTSGETGDKQTDYSFRYSQRFFNDRVQVVIGGKVSTGANASNSAQSFIDNISVEYRLDNSGSRSVRVFHNKNYESVLDGEITETGIGLVLRRKMDKLGELFIFKRKNTKPSRPTTSPTNQPSR